MNKTLTEKILAKNAEKIFDETNMTISSVDLVMIHDGSAPTVLDILETMQKSPSLSKDKIVMCIDHYVPSPSKAVSAIHRRMQYFSEKHATFYNEGKGVCHQLMVEQHVEPGMLVVGADSHSVMYGGLSALGVGVGSSDMAVAISTGKLWFFLPQTIQVNLSGNLMKFVGSKDVALTLLRDLKSNGANYKALEFTGNGLPALSMDDRFTISNQVTETGAKSAIFPCDKVTLNWLKNKRGKSYTENYPDEGAEYQDYLSYNLSEINPMIALPHSVDNVKPVKEVEGASVDVAVIGTCTNGRLSDLEIAAEFLTHHDLNPNVRLLVVPASIKIYQEALEQGLINILVHKGATVIPPCCGPCCGALNGVPRNGENVISTANRNFIGRMGNKDASIFLGSPATAVASAIKGKITDPRRLLF